MATKKDKLIEEAQRMALRGQLDKAIKLYEQVLQLEPSLINHRQKLAELLARAGYVKEARAEFETIGRHYSFNGLYLKAIAVYKKLQTMFPGDTVITLTLAGLYEKHGLVANALAEYKQVYDDYVKNSNSWQALKTLEKMQSVDKQSVNIRLKLAEAYFENDKKEDSYAAFGRLASMLQEKGDSTAFEKVNSRIKQLFPEKSEFVLEVLAEQIAEGKAASAVSGLQSLLRSDPGNKRTWELIIETYRQLDQPQRVKAALQRYLHFFPGDLIARKGLLECLIAERDLNGALAFLDLNEQDFLDGLPSDNLVKLFKALEQLDPINVRILKGLHHVYELRNEHETAATVAASISSLRVFSEKAHMAESPNEAQESLQKQFIEPDYWSDDKREAPESVSLMLDEACPDLAEVVSSPAASLIAEEDAYVGNAFFSSTAALPAVEDEIEIEIELDDDEHSGFDKRDFEDKGFSSVDVVLDGIASSPRSVKFGNDLEISDAQSHHDLGIAFKEMGLYDEAVNEFRQASTDKDRRIACLVLQGACIREKGDIETAENVLRSLMKPELNQEEACLVRYELALICEAAGKGDEAADLLAEIDRLNPGFRDVQSRLEAADGCFELDFSDEELQGFDLK